MGSPHLRKRRRIDYRAFPSQQIFHDDPHKFKGFSGPVGSGKSKALAVEALRLAYLNPGLAGVIAAPTYRMLEDVTSAALLELVEANRVPHRFKKDGNKLILLEPKSTIRFRSMDNPARLVGSNLAWFGVDELTYCKEDGWLRLMARLRHPQARRLEGFAGWTPKGFDWVYERFLGKGIAEYRVIQAKPGENTALAPGYYESLKASYDPKFYEQEVLGKYLSIFAGQAYYAFDRRENVGPVSFDPTRPICWALDFNVNPMASVVCQIVGGDLRVLQEIVLPNSNTAECCKVFGERIQPYLKARKFTPYGATPLQVLVFGDASGNARHSSSGDKTDWKIVRDFMAREHSDLSAEFRSHHDDPSVKARVNEVNAMLLNAEGVRRMTLNPTCRELIADLEQVSWRTDTDGNSLSDLDKSNQKRTHVSDALGYLIDKEFGLRQAGGPRSGNLGG